MILTTLSPDFTPRSQALRFGIDTESESPQDVELEVVDATTDTTLARQLLREVTTAELNIAPYTREFTDHKPSQVRHSSFKEAPSSLYAIRSEESLSEPLRITVNRRVQSTPTLVTSMPHNRTISLGERDELLLLACPDDHIEAIITGDTGEEITLGYTTSTGATILSISTEDFASNIGTLDVEIVCNGEKFATLHYRMVRSGRKAMRVAWISSEGSIERYTFPVTAQRQQKSEKRTVAMAEGQRVVSTTTEQTEVLLSRYEPRLTIEALAEIISATKVWVERYDNCHEVEVLTSVVDHNLMGEPDSLRLTIRQWRRKEGAL